MPLTREHAFGEGPAFPHPRSGGTPAIARRAVAAALPSSRALRSALRAWRVFDARAIVGPDVLLGPHAWCVNQGPRERVSIGARSVCRGLLRRELFGDGSIAIAEEVYIGDDCLISASAGVRIGPRTLLAHGVQVFDNGSHPLDLEQRRRDWAIVRSGGREPRRGIDASPVTIGADAWLGLGAIVLPGVTIGDGAVVGAGSVVTRDVPPQTLCVGNPARPVSPAHDRPSDPSTDASTIS